MTEQMNAYDNIFSKGCLVQLTVSVWGGAKKIDEARAKAALGSEWAKARKSLIDPDALKPIAKVRNEARTYLRARSLPFPIHGVAFVPFEALQVIDGQLEAYKATFEGECSEFYAGYPELAQAAREVLGELYEQTDYPADIAQHFGFSWRFITMQAPGQNSYLSPELVAREQKKFIDTMEQAREMAVSALREEFKAILANCVDRLTPNADGSRKIFKDSLVANFAEFFETFKTRNVFGDTELAALCEQAEKILEGVEPDGLRKDEGLRNTIQVSMATLAGALDAAIVDAPKRALKFD